MEYSGGVELIYREGSNTEWEQLLQMHSQEEPKHCISNKEDLRELFDSNKKYQTGSEYDGSWNLLGMKGRGRYKFPNGVVYVGEMSDGEFHGHGELRYQDGSVLRGRWGAGVLLEKTLIFSDGCEYAENNWTYCTMPDRRFTIERNEGLQPAGLSYQTAEQPTPWLPPGCYDTVDGFYDPRIRMVMHHDDKEEILRAPSKREQEWIVASCRRAWTQTCGAKPRLYEEWETLEP